ncbi:hypothetical protein EVAR_65326_1 [Eumeta japonica]|uniref:Uncharacterized protein n=1 Tax=Eumeta variegata TaxID=151549 RepID=A0A4C1YRD9_EUMVA|nr:hypothetical protein EVAR_65326_1 [Eumeta japonica]
MRFSTSYFQQRSLSGFIHLGYNITLRTRRRGVAIGQQHLKNQLEHNVSYACTFWLHNSHSTPWRSVGAFVMVAEVIGMTNGHRRATLYIRAGAAAVRARPAPPARRAARPARIHILFHRSCPRNFPDRKLCSTC